MVDGKYATVGPGATTGLMIDAGTATTEEGGTVEVVWTVAFGAAPFPVASYNSVATTNVLTWSAVTTTNGILTGDASTNVYWQAIGARP